MPSLLLSSSRGRFDTNGVDLKEEDIGLKWRKESRCFKSSYEAWSGEIAVGCRVGDTIARMYMQGMLIRILMQIQPCHAARKASSSGIVV